MSYIHWLEQEPGFNPVLKPYQMSILEILDASNYSPIGSKEIFFCVNKEGENISRASVINFLEKLRKEGIIIGTKGTGKGGKRYNYRLREGADVDSVLTHLAFRMVSQMQEANPKINFIWITENLATVQDGGEVK